MFLRKTDKPLEKFIEDIDFENVSWLSLSINQENQEKLHHDQDSLQFEIHLDQFVYVLSVQTLPSQEIEVGAWKGKKKKFFGKLSREKFFNYFSPFLEGFMQGTRNHLIAGAKRESTLNINPTNEPQGHEWLKTSLLVLKSALEQAFSTSDQGLEKNFLQVLLFSGNHPAKKAQTFRLRIFNLDLELIEDKTNTLRLKVINKGRANSFVGIEPVFSGFFSKKKNEVTDEFILLLSPIARSIVQNIGHNHI